MLALWGVLQWVGLSHINDWLAPDRDLSNASNAAYADNWREFLQGCSPPAPGYLYALIVYFTLCKLLSNWKIPVLTLMILASLAINYLPLPRWGMNSVVRNMIFYTTGAWYGNAVMEWVKTVAIRRYALLFAVHCGCLGIMRLFRELEQRFPPSENSLLNLYAGWTAGAENLHRTVC